MVDSLGVAVEHRCNYLTIYVLKFLFRQELSCFMHPLKVVFQFLPSLIILYIVHSQNEFKALIRNESLMLIFFFVVQIFIGVASMEEHGLSNSHNIRMIKPRHYIKALDLLHAGVHMLPIPFPSIDPLGLGYLKTVCSVGIDCHKLPCLFNSVDCDFVDATKCALP